MLLTINVLKIDFLVVDVLEHQQCNVLGRALSTMSVSFNLHLKVIIKIKRILNTYFLKSNTLDYSKH
jgi:hypothetical protein